MCAHKRQKGSLADLIVLAGCAGVEKAAKDAGHCHNCSFYTGRMDASQDKPIWNHSLPGTIAMVSAIIVTQNTRIYRRIADR